MRNKSVVIIFALLCVLLIGSLYLVETYKSRLHLFERNIPFTEELICKRYVYDVSEWTLTYKNKAYSETNKSENDFKCENELIRLLNSTSIKRIVHSNNSVENRGCKKNTTQCKENAHFNFMLNKRLNTPPCCREKLLEMLTHFTKELQRIHIPHMLAFGSVIGWARNGKMVPYDTDIDLIVDKEFWKTPLFYNVLNKLEIKYGYKTAFVDNGVKLRIMYSSINFNMLEVWPFEIKKYGHIPKVVIPHSGWKLQPLENLFPQRYVSFSNIRTYVPRDANSYLNILYNNWKSELDCSYKKDYKCA